MAARSMFRGARARATLLSTLAVLACSEGGVESADAARDVAAAPPSRSDRVSALGWIEPEDGLVRVAGPSGNVNVIGELLVEEGDRVEADQVIATLDTLPILDAEVERLRAELTNAHRELQRHEKLNTNNVVSDSARDIWLTRVAVLRAELRKARAEIERANVRSPISGRVIDVHAHRGERVGDTGIVELGRTDHMYAIAEVYETDVGRVRVGQKATISSPALPAPLTGVVDFVHLKVAKQDTLGTDPAARKDARVVEVEIRLDDSAAASPFTNLQVEVEIDPHVVAAKTEALPEP